jgi:hypothetical protein
MFFFLGQKCVSEIVKQQLMDVTSGMSARERNRAKRRTKLLAKQRSRDVQRYLMFKI